MHASKLNIASLIESVTTDEEFWSVAKDIYKIQYEMVPAYRNFVVAVSTQTNGQEVFLPIEAFKWQEINSESTSEVVFKSSGTTTQNRSSHHVYSQQWYSQLSVRNFEMQFGALKDWEILAFLPNYIENGDSSLVFMVKEFAMHAGRAGSPFMNDKNDLARALRHAVKSGKKVLLVGVSFALLDLAEYVGEDQSEFVIMETGGMKGKRKELTRDELHTNLTTAFPNAQIWSEYGMTELLTQAYSADGKWFKLPPWARAFTTEINDPLRTLDSNRRGLLAFIDLANIHSCSFIQTRDIGIVNSKGWFTVEGRLDNSDLRGCNLLHA